MVRAERIALVEAYCKENALWHDPDEAPTYSQVVELDLSSVEPSLAGPRRPQDRVPLREAKRAFFDTLHTVGVDYGNGHDEPSPRPSRRATRSRRPPGNEAEHSNDTRLDEPRIVLASRRPSK